MHPKQTLSSNEISVFFTISSALTFWFLLVLQKSNVVAGVDKNRNSKVGKAFTTRFQFNFGQKRLDQIQLMKLLFAAAT